LALESHPVGTGGDEATGREEVPQAPGAPQAAEAPVEPKPGGRTGRNLPAAIAVGALLGGIVLLTLLTVKVTFLLFMGAAVGVALGELTLRLKDSEKLKASKNEIHLPVIPVAVGGAALIACTYWLGTAGALGALVLTVIAILAWRLPSGAEGYIRDVTAGVFALVYLPLMAALIAAMLSAPDGARRVLTFVIVTICSDIGGYFAGITVGKHKLAPVISPKKTWEGLGGSVLACLIAGAILLPAILHGHAWQGVILGAAAAVAATFGDLVESLIKRDLDIKDMSNILPGHGGLLDRIDSLLITAPVVWLLLIAFLR
jgi:phosphatidate cytidylyltransferase